MTVLSVIAFIFGVLGVWLTIKQNILCWPIAIVAVLASILEFYNERLFGDMSLQIFYFFAAVYGWIFWNQQNKTEFFVTKMPDKFWFLIIGFTILQSGLYCYLLRYFGGDRPMFDGILTAASLTATYMMTRKWLENWAAWVLIDFAYVILYGIKLMWMFALLYLVFAVIAWYGWIKWRKTLL